MSSPIFSAADVLRIAVKNEREGEAFYRQIAARSTEPTVRDLFLLLADEEPRHADLFNQMLAAVGSAPPIQAELDEYVGYMIAYYHANLLFADNQADTLTPAPDPIAALDFGIQRELDSIGYYTQIKSLVPASQAALIDKIIAEERSHFLQFSKLKRTRLAEAGGSHQGEAQNDSRLSAPAE